MVQKIAKNFVLFSVLSLGSVAIAGGGGGGFNCTEAYPVEPLANCKGAGGETITVTAEPWGCDDDDRIWNVLKIWQGETHWTLEFVQESSELHTEGLVLNEEPWSAAKGTGHELEAEVDHVTAALNMSFDGKTVGTLVLKSKDQSILDLTMICRGIN